MSIELDMLHLADRVKALEKRVDIVEKSEPKSVVAAKMEKKAAAGTLIECPECAHRLLVKSNKPYCINCEIEY